MEPTQPPPLGDRNSREDQNTGGVTISPSPPGFETGDLSTNSELDVFGDPIPSPLKSASDSGWVARSSQRSADLSDVENTPVNPYSYALASVAQGGANDRRIASQNLNTSVNDPMKRYAETKRRGDKIIENWERTSQVGRLGDLSAVPGSTPAGTISTTPGIGALITPATDITTPATGVTTPAPQGTTKPATNVTGRGGGNSRTVNKAKSRNGNNSQQRPTGRDPPVLETPRAQLVRRSLQELYDQSNAQSNNGNGSNPNDRNNNSHGTPPGNRPDPKYMYEDYQIRMVDGWTMNDGTFEQQPMIKRRKIDVPYPHMVNHSFRAMSGLSGLQIAHNAPVSQSALDIACEHMWKCLHDDVRSLVRVAPPNGPTLWSGDKTEINRMYDRIAQPVYKYAKTGEYLFYSQIKDRPWVVWPLWVEDDFGKDFVTVLLYSEKAGALNKTSVYNQLVRYTIIDPRRARYGTKRPGAVDSDVLKCDFPHARTERIEGALRDFLERAGYDLTRVPLVRTTDGKLSSPMTVTHCSPMPSGEYTSGERCFATVKELLERIVQWYLRGPEKQPEEVFRHLRPWVNPFQFRIEMTGINAWILMATLGYDARITVETIPPDDYEVIVNGKRKHIETYDLAGPYDIPPLAPRDWLLPGEAEPTPVAGNGSNTGGGGGGGGGGA